jgi:diguanylate cyclase (GGDEF)-like protein/PAS domain S-box-containing protein
MIWPTTDPFKNRTMFLSSSDPSSTQFADLVNGLGDIALNLQKQSTVDDIVSVGAKAVKDLFSCDRALVYQILPDGDSVVLAESVGADTPAIVGQLIHDPCLQRKWMEPYRQGRTSAVENIDHSDLEACHVELLKQLQVKANLVAPIVVPAAQPEAESQLWGLLIVHECHQPRVWKMLHHQVLRHIGTHIGLALRHGQTQQQFEALQQRATRWQTALEAAEDGVWDWNVKTNEVYFSHEWKTMLGYADEDIGNTFGEWLSRVHPDDLDKVHEALHHHFAGYTSFYRSEHRVRAENGSWRWILDRGRVVDWTTDGKPLRVIGTHVDVSNFKQAEQQVQLQSAALEACADVVVITDYHGDIEWVNPAFEALTGYRPEEAIGKNPRDLIKSGQQDAAFYRQLWQQILAGQVWRGELVNRRKDGSLYHEEMTITPVGNRWGSIQHFVAIKQDVTERHRMEQRLRDRDEMLRKISEQVPGVIYQYRLYADSHSCFPYASEAIRYIYEVTPEQVQTDAQPVLSRLHPEDYDRVIEGILTSSKTLEFWHDEYRVQLPERGERWLEGHAMPEQLEDGSVLWHGYIWDITERKNMQLAIQKSEALFRGVFEQAIVGISLVGTNQKFRLANQRFCDLMGYTETELLQKGFLELTHPDDIVSSLSYFRQVLQGQVPNTSIEKRYIRKDRQVWWANVAVSPIYDDRGSLLHIFSLVVDITDRKRAEAQLQQEFQRERMIHLIDHHIRESLDLETVLQTTVQEVRQFLNTDRVIIYRFQSDWAGVIVAESVAPGWLSILAQEITDTFFVETRGASYDDHHINIVNDIYTAGLSNCHIKLMESMQVRAKLVVPILQGNHLWGLLIAHHCQGPRPWQDSEGHLLQQLTHQLALAIQHAELHHQLQTANQELETISNTDALTQINNRRCFDTILPDALYHAHWAQQPLALILCDIDYFKQYNDTYGHPAGDACLAAVAQALEQCLKRPSDLLARYGGEEFAVILPNTGLTGAIAVVEEMQQTIAALNLAHQSHCSASLVTLSFGITALVPSSQDQSQTLLHYADQALYEAKASGRNRYRCFSSP